MALDTLERTGKHNRQISKMPLAEKCSSKLIDIDERRRANKVINTYHNKNKETIQITIYQIALIVQCS